MDKEFLITVCVAFLTQQVFYGFRWWKADKGGEKLLRHFAYALFVGLLNWATLFMLSEYINGNLFIQILVSFAISLFMLMSDWYGPFIEGKNVFESDEQK